MRGLTRINVREIINHALDFIDIKKARNYGLQSCILQDTWHSWYVHVLKTLPLLRLKEITDLGACPSCITKKDSRMYGNRCVDNVLKVM